MSLFQRSKGLTVRLFSAEPTHQSNNSIYLVSVAVALLAVAVFLPALGNDFVSFDDPLYITDNPAITSLNLSFFRWAFTTFTAANWHPLTWISHAVDYAIWGLSPLGHHLTSVLLHGINSFLVTLFCWIVVGVWVKSREDQHKSPLASPRNRLAAALVAGLLFAIHPIHVESVAWVSERKDVLCALFYLLSVIAYLRRPLFTGPVGADSWGGGWYAASLVFHGLALLSKPMAVTLPAVLIILDWMAGRYRRGRLRAALLEKIPFLILSIASSGITLAAQQQLIAQPLVIPYQERIALACSSLLHYLGKLVYPVHLAPFYPYPASVNSFSSEWLLPMVVVAMVTAGAVWGMMQRKSWAAAWACYVIMLLPVIGIIQVGDQAMADRYLYLPGIPVFLLIAGSSVSFVAHVSKRNVTAWFWPALLGASAIVLSLLIFFTVRQIGFWKDGRTLWLREIEIEPDAAIAYNNLGAEAKAAGRLAEAAQLFSRAAYGRPTGADANGTVEMRRPPLVVAKATKNLGLVLVQLGRYSEALHVLQQAMTLSYYPDARVLNGMAICLMETGRYEEALSVAQQAVSASEGGFSGVAYNTLGELYFKRNDYQKALDAFLKALLNEPKPVRLYNVALTYEKLGNVKEACGYFSQYKMAIHDPQESERVGRHLLELHCCSPAKGSSDGCP